MNKETIPVAVGALILGFVLGIAFPQLFPDSQQQTNNSQDDDHQHQQAPPMPEKITEEQVNHALKYYREMLEKDPNNKDIYVSMGNICYDAGKYQEAIENYQKALDIDPSLSNARVDMAVMYRRLGQPETAVKVLQETISLDPKHYIARLNLGIILKNDIKDYHLATNSFKEFLKIAPDNYETEFVKKLIKEMEPELKPKADK